MSRGNGWEELRREIEALPFDAHRLEGAPAWVIDRAAVLAIVDRLAAARGEPPCPDPSMHKWPKGTGPEHPYDEIANPDGFAAARGEPGLDVERLASGIAYAMVRTALPGSDETSRDYANRLAPLVIESGYLATPTTPEPDQ